MWSNGIPEPEFLRDKESNPRLRKEATMPGDPKQCRQHAEHCVQLANTMKNEIDRGRMLNIASTWLKLADELERAKTIINESISRQPEIPIPTKDQNTG